MISMELLSTLLLIPLLTALLAFAARWAGALTHMLVTVIQSAGIALLVYAAGILTECYINPWIAEKLLTFVDFF